MLVLGNWKMNGEPASAKALVTGILDSAPFESDVGVLPPALLVKDVAEQLEGTAIKVGVQNVDWHESGAFTGEVSVPMAKSVGAVMSLVGHSERRTLFGESDETVARKFEACLAGDLSPVLCVGETRAEREAGETGNVVRRQVRAVLDLVGAERFEGAIVAYEPVWAIGTGLSATPQEADAVHAEIRALLGSWSAALAATTILYGGSVKPDNAADLFQQENIDGALVGGASLQANDFVAICRAASA